MILTIADLEMYYNCIKLLGKLFKVIGAFKSVDSYVYTKETYSVDSLFVKFNFRDSIYLNSHTKPSDSYISMIRHNKLKLIFKM